MTDQPLDPATIAEMQEWLTARVDDRFGPVGEDMARQLLAEVDRLAAALTTERERVQKLETLLGAHEHDTGVTVVETALWRAALAGESAYEPSSVPTVD